MIVSLNTQGVHISLDARRCSPLYAVACTSLDQVPALRCPSNACPVGKNLPLLFGVVVGCTAQHQGPTAPYPKGNSRCSCAPC